MSKNSIKKTYKSAGIGLLIISLISNVVQFIHFLEAKQKSSNLEQAIYDITLHTFHSYTMNLENSIEDVHAPVSFTKMKGNIEDLLNYKNLYPFDEQNKELDESFVALTDQIRDVGFEYWNGRDWIDLPPKQLKELKTISENYSQLDKEIMDIWMKLYAKQSQRELAEIQLDLSKTIKKTVEANKKIIQ